MKTKAMKTIAITGTNGKTTIAFWIYQLIGKLVAYVGTLGATTSAMKGYIETGFTTPDAATLGPLLEKFKQDGCEWLVIEASSHGLKQERINALNVKIAIFTNLSQDHLDYHRDLNDYFTSKAMLFARPELRHAIINIDDEHGHQLNRMLNDSKITTLTYSANGHNDAEIRLKSCVQSAGFWIITIDSFYKDIQLSIPVKNFVATNFNLSNLLAVVAVARLLEFDQASLSEKIAKLQPPPGRLQAVNKGQSFGVLVDFAHTPDALENMLSNLKLLGNNKLIAIFGCGGDRDKGKRPIMASIGAKYADVVILTADNPRNESPLGIIDDMLKGVIDDAAAMEKISVEADRKKAIHQGLSIAKSGDIVVIAGKGHETRQTINNQTIAFDDVLVASNYLETIEGGEINAS